METKSRNASDRVARAGGWSLAECSAENGGGGGGKCRWKGQCQVQQQNQLQQVAGRVDGRVKRAKRVDDDAGGEKSVGCQ